jgi:hypothetical protein
MNWGKSIMWVFIAFAAGMMFLVYRATQTQFELVEDDYYEQELNFQNQINQTNAAVINHQKLRSWITGNQINIQIEGVNKPVYGGQVWFYDAQNRKNDRKFELARKDSAFWVIPAEKFPKELLANGCYEIKGMWIIGKDTFRGETKW